MTGRTHSKRTAAQKSCSLPKACGFGLLSVPISSLMLAPIATGIAYAQADPIKAALPASLIALYATVLVCGIVAARKSDTPFFAAGICGGLLLVITLLSALLPFSTVECGFSTPITFLTHLAIPGTAMLGAFLGHRRQKKISTHRRHRR